MAVTTALVFHVHGGDDRQKCKAVTTALVFRAHSAEANVGWVIGFLVLVDLIVSQRHGGIWAHGGGGVFSGGLRALGDRHAQVVARACLRPFVLASPHVLG